MTDAADIEGEESLKAWLETRAAEDSIWIAHRAAARVLPIWWDYCLSDPHKELAAISCLRALLISSERTRYSSPEIRKSAAFEYSLPKHAASVRAAHVAASAAVSAPTRATYAAASGLIKFAREKVDLTKETEFSSARAAAYAGLAAWKQVRHDARFLEHSPRGPRAIWDDGEDPIGHLWRSVKRRIPKKSASNADYHSFWLPWYEDLREGRHPRFSGDLQKSIALIEQNEWEQGDIHVNNVVIPALVRGDALDVIIEDAVEEPSSTALADAYPTDFAFDAIAKVMRMIGIEDDNAHLRKPEIVQAFSDDAEEVRDALQDFADYASDIAGGGNYAGVLKRSAEKVLTEFTRTKDQTHLRARRIVKLAEELELFSQDEDARADIKGPLTKILDDAMVELKALCRKHFGPSYLALAPLADLKLEHVDQDAVLAMFDDIIIRLQSGAQDDVVVLDAEGQAVLQSMLRELHESREILKGASSDQFRLIIENRFAQNSGALGLTLNRYAEQSYRTLGTIHSTGKEAVSIHKTVKGLWDILKAVGITFGVGGAG